MRIECVADATDQLLNNGRQAGNLLVRILLLRRPWLHVLSLLLHWHAGLVLDDHVCAWEHGWCLGKHRGHHPGCRRLDQKTKALLYVVEILQELRMHIHLVDCLEIQICGNDLDILLAVSIVLILARLAL